MKAFPLKIIRANLHYNLARIMKLNTTLSKLKKRTWRSQNGFLKKIGKKGEGILPIFKVKYINGKVGYWKIVSCCQIQNRPKNSNFEISRPVEYSTGMILAEYSEDFGKMAYFHTIFDSSSKTDVLIVMRTLWKP